MALDYKGWWHGQSDQPIIGDILASEYHCVLIVEADEAPHARRCACRSGGAERVSGDIEVPEASRRREGYQDGRGRDSQSGGPVMTRAERIDAALTALLECEPADNGLFYSHSAGITICQGMPNGLEAVL